MPDTIEALTQRIETLAYESRLKDLRIEALEGVIASYQRFGTLSKYDEDRLERARKKENA